MKKAFYYCGLLLLLLCSRRVLAQLPDYGATREKIYLHTSHVFFRPGEQLFFKLYLVKAKDQTPSGTSGNAYVEVIGPGGNLVRKLNYKVENGYAEGSYEFEENAPGGIYKLRAYTNWMRNEGDSSLFTRELTVMQTIAPRVLMKLDFPVKGYGAGDEVTAAFSARNLNDLPIRNHPAQYTVAVGGRQVKTGSFTTDAAGKAKIVFQLPETLSVNDGLLNITFRYDAYTESISRSIPIQLNRIDLQLMPEGGRMVTGLATQVAFKALNENGKPADVSGEIRDEQGKVVTGFQSYHAGMGKFSFTPQAGHRYIAVITAPSGIRQSVHLPDAQETGVVMNIETGATQLLVKLASASSLRVTLKGEMRNEAHYTRNITLHKGEQTIAIGTEDLPAGINRFTLCEQNGRPLAERIVFLNEQNLLQVQLSTDKRLYQPREKVTMTVRTTDRKGHPVSSNLSLAVVNDQLWTMADDKQNHILSWLLMSTELKGKIDEPSFYFRKDEPKALPALDLVMLTHGYRYFDFAPEAGAGDTLKYLPEQEQVLSGFIRNERQEPVASQVYLVDVAAQRAISIQTGSDGLFCFSGLLPNRNYQLIARSKKLKERIRMVVQQNGLGYKPVRQHLLQDTLLLVQKQDPSGLARSVGIRGAGRMAAARVLADAEQADAPVKEENRLQEVVVVGFGAERKRMVAGSVAVVKEGRIAADKIATVLNGKVAGLIVQEAANPGAAPAIRIKGIGTGDRSPLLIMDGVPVEPFHLDLNAANIHSVTVLKDAAATAMYGCFAGNGVILIETQQPRRDGVKIELTRNYYYASQTVRSSQTEYAVARRFYAPRYTSVATEERSDFRETIYWNPVVQTDKEGLATLSFYNSDAATTFRAIAEGIGYNGKVGRTEMTYAAQPAIRIDAKIPPYLTVGDRALLPLVIRNNRSEPVLLNIAVQVPEKMQAGSYEKSIRIGPDTAQLVHIPVQAFAAIAGTIRFTVSSNTATETLALPVVASDKGFPVIETFSGNQSAEHRFTIGKMIPGSLRTSLRLFRSLEGQLLNGIESMLREPYGCFEQTSSATYPNLFVLRYLRESGKGNPAIEKQAMNYIETGYKRLIGYETAQNGFEWFGKTPPHEALTAYGLLEFTDMQAFIDVDRQMLARTKAFLLSRRNGKGGFLQASGGYDRFASVPGKIADIYIVYALSQAGIGNEILPEYQAAFEKAVAGKDGYQMAMMALAASNLKRAQDFDRLMQLLNQQYALRQLAAETSVVNSRDASLRVETLSLYALALAREKTPPIGQLATVISAILGEKSYYGYGSTQATVLALNAVSVYSGLVGSLAQNAGVRFAVNEQPVSDTATMLSLAEGSNLFTVKYASEAETVPYQLEVAYHTLTPPNSPRAELQLKTTLSQTNPGIGETVRLRINVTNHKRRLQPMTIAKIGIPAGLSLQPWQLKEITEKHQVAYYEMFDNYLVLYWMGLAEGETKEINLDLKAEIAGTYEGKASNVYLYYTPEHKHWNEGLKVEVKP